MTAPKPKTHLAGPRVKCMGLVALMNRDFLVGSFMLAAST